MPASAALMMTASNSTI